VRRAGLLLALLLAAPIAHAGSQPRSGPAEWLPVREPIRREFERLRASGLADTSAAYETRPLDRRTVAAVTARARMLHPESTNPSLVRLEREFAREMVDWGWDAPKGYTTPLATAVDSSTGMRLRILAYADGALVVTKDSTEFADRSRFGGRLNVEHGGFLLHFDAYAGRVDRAREFSDQLVTDSEFIAYSEDAYGSFATGPFDVTLGRIGYAWGPGQSGSLLWSQNADPVTSLQLGATLFRHFRATAFVGDIDASQGARVAGHRIEWFPSPRLTVGIAEAARFTSSHWEPLYLVPVLPYTWVQRMLNHDQIDRPDAVPAEVRNNVMGALDASWRATNGVVLYGEFLLDDQGLKVGGSPSRIGYQAGALGTLENGLGEWTGRLEYARVYRYVYSVFYGEDFIHHGKPIGYPAGPDSRSVFADARWSPNADWEFGLGGRQLEHGEGTLGEFFDPDSGAAEGSALSGVVERTRGVTAEARWWPRDGIDLSAAADRDWIANAGHIDGREETRWALRFAVRLHK
jgi:hypothetical protein